MEKSERNSILDIPTDEAPDARLDADAEARCDAEAEADYAAGRVIPHERMREWLAKLAKGERVPPPEG